MRVGSRKVEGGKFLYIFYLLGRMYMREGAGGTKGRGEPCIGWCNFEM